jgi:hypothetical protein
MTAGAFTKIGSALATVVSNIGTVWDTTNFKFVARRAGHYNIIGMGSMDTVATQKIVVISLYKGGADFRRGTRMETNTASNSTPGLAVSANVLLAAADAIELYLYNGDASNRTTTALASCVWMAGTEIL